MRDPGGWPRTLAGVPEGPDSKTLASLLAHERELALPPWPLGGAAALLEPVAVALAALHAKGNWHLAVTPGAIFVRTGARVDAGTGAAVRLVTPSESSQSSPRSHRAPEQHSEAYGLAGPWTDVFALALVFVELVTGRRAEADGPAQLGAAAIDSFRRARRSTLPAEAQDLIEPVLDRALSIYPAERFQTVETFWRVLSQALAWDPGGLAWHVGRSTLTARRSR